MHREKLKFALLSSVRGRHTLIEPVICPLRKSAKGRISMTNTL